MMRRVYKVADRFREEGGPGGTTVIGAFECEGLTIVMVPPVPKEEGHVKLHWDALKVENGIINLIAARTKADEGGRVSLGGRP